MKTEQKEQINVLILTRIDTKNLILAECEIIKEILEESGLLPGEANAVIASGALPGMGFMSVIPDMLAKITPLKECLPHVKTIMRLSALYTETLELQLDTVTMLVLEGA